MFIPGQDSEAPKPKCYDNGAEYYAGCLAYNNDPEKCADVDDNDSIKELCCICGGGTSTQTSF